MAHKMCISGSIWHHFDGVELAHVGHTFILKAKVYLIMDFLNGSADPHTHTSHIDK